jgi:signal transduction histidine kinase
MIGERFGALGNERYLEYMKDIRASGERVIAIINDLLDLSEIETGKLDLAFTNQNLNELVESCVCGAAAAGQSRAHHHPHLAGADVAAVIADARALAPDHAEPDRQFDPSRQCRRPGHRLDRACPISAR